MQRHFDHVQLPLRSLVSLPAIVVLAAVLLLPVRRLSVQGRSMLPALKPGDRVAVGRLAYRVRSPRNGEVAVLHQPDGFPRLDIKRVHAGPGETVLMRGREVVLGPDEWFVQGDNRDESTDSRHLGPVRRKDFVGPVWFIYLRAPDPETARQ
jgi:signal peptidase I